jgi:hypothetical protein
MSSEEEEKGFERNFKVSLEHGEKKISENFLRKNDSYHFRIDRICKEMFQLFKQSEKNAKTTYHWFDYLNLLWTEGK